MVVSINKTVESYLSACVIFLVNFHQQILCFINNIFGDLMYSFTCILSGTILCVFPLCNLHLMLGSVDIQMHAYMHYLALYNRIFLNFFCLFVCSFRPNCIFLCLEFSFLEQVYLYGAQVTSWKNEHGEELLFLSSKVLQCVMIVCSKAVQLEIQNDIKIFF